MATSGSTKVNVVSSGNIYLLFSWSAGTQSVNGNYTPINWSLKLVSVGNGANISSTASKDYKVVVDGQTWSGTNTIGLSAGATKTLASGTKNIYHNDDGSKTFSYSFSQEIAITYSGSSIGTKSGSGSGVLNTIPRTSSISSITGNTIGSAVTVNISRNSTSFTHKVYYTFGDSVNVLAGSDIGTSCTFTPAMSDCNYLPNATSGTATIKVETYNGTTLIGSVTKTFTLNVPSSVVPTISSVTTSEGNTEVVPSSWGIYVKNKSKLKFVVSAGGVYSSTISTIKTTINGSTYTGTEITTNLIDVSGSLTATIVVTDSRGRSTTTTKTITIVDYDDPYINEFSVIRCDADGNESKTGTYAKVTLGGGIYPLNGKNTPFSYVIQYKKVSENEYQTYTFDVTESSINTDVILSNIDGSSSYNFVAVISDYFNSVKQNAQPLLSAFRTMSYKAGGRGVGIGKVAEEDDLLDIAFQTRLAGGLKPVFLEADTNLDNVKTPNFYTGQNITNYNYINCPLTKGTFYLEVVSCGGEGQLRQTITSCSKTDAVSYTRFYYESAWGDWVYSGCLSSLVLPAGTDLDNIFVVGKYAGGNQTSYQYLNVPSQLTSGTFSLEVFSMGDSGQRRQRLTTTDKTNSKIYERFYYQSSWGDWIKCPTEPVVLFEGASNGTINLNDSVANYEYIEVFFYYGSTGYNSSVKAYSINGKMINMIASMANQTSSAIYFASTMATVNGTTITPTYYGEYTITSNSWAYKTNRLYITKVLGYR